MEESILMWNRLESSLRNENQLEKGLRFEVRDPLWMLTRQWQFGELDGEDAGTATFATIESEQTAITATGSAGKPPRDFDIRNTPLDTALEQEPVLPDLPLRLEMGRHWERLLRKRLPAEKAAQAIKEFRSNPRFQFTSGLPANPDRAGLFQHAHHYSDQSRLAMMQALSGGRAIDGFALLTELEKGVAASVFLSQPDELVNGAGQEFRNWYKRLYGQDSNSSNWHPQHLEYQPQLAFAGSKGQACILRRGEYHGDGVEWHGFEPKPSWSGQGQAMTTGDRRIQKRQTVIPSHVRFRGMPSVRLWQMEDAQVDFGSIRASSTELSKMLFAEFGLVYGNDWMIAPQSFDCGTLGRVSKVTVTDSFGAETLLGETEADPNWAFYQGVGMEPGRSWLLLANGAGLLQEGPAVEQVCFMRDEMANMVWASEEIISDPLGGGRDGETLARKTAELVNSLRKKDEKAGEGRLSSEGWVYKAGTLMAENRVPFIPIKMDTAQLAKFERRAVVLQRAAMPRVSDDFPPVRIRPGTTLLGYTGRPAQERPEPFFVFEEEIPKTGARLSLHWRRTRWFNGQTHVWMAKKKTPGAGEIDAHFGFDGLGR